MMVPGNDGISISPRICLSIFSIAALNLLEMKSSNKVVVDFGVPAIYLPRNLVSALKIGLVLPLTSNKRN